MLNVKIAIIFEFLNTKKKKLLSSILQYIS